MATDEGRLVQDSPLRSRLQLLRSTCCDTNNLDITLWQAERLLLLLRCARSLDFKPFDLKIDDNVVSTIQRSLSADIANHIDEL